MIGEEYYSPPGPSFLGLLDSGSGSVIFTESSPLGKSTSGIFPSSYMFANGGMIGIFKFLLLSIEHHSFKDRVCKWKKNIRMSGRL